MVDAFMERCHSVLKVSEFQMVGITCLHMAAKVEEIYPPHITCFSTSTNDSVSTDQMNRMEIRILQTLNWNLENFQTYFLWTQWFMQRWDSYVDESLSYLK